MKSKPSEEINSSGQQLSSSTTPPPPPPPATNPSSSPRHSNRPTSGPPTDHNRLHAADVLHAVYYLTSQPIDNFCQVPLDLIDHYDHLLASTRPDDSLAALNRDGHRELASNLSGEFASKLHNHIVAIVVAAAVAAADSELPFGIMGANLTALEVMALYTAAAMHDFQHPGRTNSFLVATSSPLVSSASP